MKHILFMLLVSLSSCSGSIGWGTHKIIVDAEDSEPIKKEKDQ